MARSTYIYLVTYELGCGAKPQAAFTVKHELMTYLRQIPEKSYLYLHVYRLKDGYGFAKEVEPVDITEDILGPHEIR